MGNCQDAYGGVRTNSPRVSPRNHETPIHFHEHARVRFEIDASMEATSHETVLRIATTTSIYHHPHAPTEPHTLLPYDLGKFPREEEQHDELYCRVMKDYNYGSRVGYALQPATTTRYCVFGRKTISHF